MRVAFPSAEDVSCESTANGVFVSDGTKVDDLRSVERVIVTDGTLVLDTGAGETAGMAFRLYKAAFDRAPDTGGLRFWIDKLDAGASITSVADGFLQSPEFRRKSPENVALVGAKIDAGLFLA